MQEAELKVLLKKVGPNIRRTASKWSAGNSGHFEDLVQLGNIGVASSADTLTEIANSEDHLMALLTLAARRSMIDFIRMNYRHHRGLYYIEDINTIGEETVVPNQLVDASTLAAPSAERMLQMRRARTALDRLPPRTRQIVSCLQRGETEAEIARRLGVHVYVVSKGREAAAHVLRQHID